MVDRGTQLDVSEEFEREKGAAGVNEQSGMSCSVITSLKSKNKDAQESPVLTTVRPQESLVSGMEKQWPATVEDETDTHILGHHDEES